MRGKLLVVRKSGDHEEPFIEQEVEVPPGKRVFTVPQEVEDPDFYTYEARFVPDDPADDGMTQNNSASGFVHVRGRGHVLFIENWDKQGEFDYLVDRLRKEEIAVTMQPTDRLFTSLAELQRVRLRGDGRRIPAAPARKPTPSPASATTRSACSCETPVS